MSHFQTLCDECGHFAPSENIQLGIYQRYLCPLCWDRVVLSDDLRTVAKPFMENELMWMLTENIEKCADRAAALEAENIRLKELLAEPPSKAQIQIRAHRLEYGELDIPGDIDRAQAREEKG